MSRKTHVLLGCLCTVALALFWHFRQEHVPYFHVHAIADRFVIADVDFLCPDAEATSMMQERSVRDVGAIYRLDPQRIRDIRAGLLSDESWRENLQHTTYEEVLSQVNLVEKTLLHVRFTDPRTLQKIKDFHKKTLSSYYLTSPKENDFWSEVQRKVGADKNETSTFIVQFFQNQEWPLTEDKGKKRILWNLIKEKIPKHYIKVRAGTKLLSPGDEVTARHVHLLQALREAKEEARPLKDPFYIAGSLLFGGALTLMGAAYLKRRHVEIFQLRRKLMLLTTVLLLTLLFAKVTEYALMAYTVVEYPIFVPFAAILVCILINFEMALFVGAFLTVFFGLTLPVEPMSFILINVVASLVAATAARRIHRRREIFSLSGQTFLWCAPLVIAQEMCAHTLFDVATFLDLAFLLGFLFLTALIAVAILPILENYFRITTDMTLMEFMDPDFPLLRRLSVEAPGTYQHSLVVGHLAESAARAIHANDLFCRTAALYHDIGKLIHPHYFTENQSGGFNIHPLLTPAESAQMIIGHVTEGEVLAKKNRLPPMFLDSIREHHGTTLVSYFYHKELERVQGDAKAVDQRAFRYTGPKPRSKESAILMIADTVEAASRSLDMLSEESVREMIDKLVKDKASDGQFDDCQLTFEELGRVKRAMAKTLFVANHMRIKYPSACVPTS